MLDTSAHYEAAAVHIRTADEQQSISHGTASDLQRAQIHALLAVVDELRALRASIDDLAKDVSSSVGFLDREQGSLSHIATAAHNIAERLPR